MKEFLNSISIQSARQELLKVSNLTIDPVDFNEYLNGKVFENQVIAYTTKLNYSVNDFVKMILDINGIK